MGALLARFVQRFTAARAAESLKDWPDDLRMSAAAGLLAPYLYEAFCMVTRGAVREQWATVHPAIKQVWRQRAAYAIRTVR
jgi:hypothetical protein